jgi:betaine lipid synthase
MGRDSYFYLLCLLGHYTRTSCPEYLKQDGVEKLRKDNGKALDTFRLHTDSILK